LGDSAEFCRSETSYRLSPSPRAPTSGPAPAERAQSQTMTKRIPPGEPIHSWVDRLIHEAEERGEFDNLPGAGKPLPGLDRPLDENWWLRQKVRDEELPSDALLPPALHLRKEVAALPQTAQDLPDEESVRAMVSEVNARVADRIRAPSGPVPPVPTADAEKFVAGWRAARDSAPEAGVSSADPGSSPEAGPVQEQAGSRRRRWWPRRRR